jgi:uncharacterized membrane protein
MEMFVEHLEHILASFVLLLKFVLEAIAAIVILLGLLRTAQIVLSMKTQKLRRKPILGDPMAFIQVRLVFGMWLALALEFQLGADILATTISPSFESLGRLGAIAIIRTFLNYFLNKELESEVEYQKTSSHAATSTLPQA